MSEASWSLRGLARALAIALVAIGVGAGAGWVVSHERTPPGPGASSSARPAAGATELGIVTPLRPGAALADYTVEHVGAIGPSGLLTVELARGPARVTLDVARTMPGAPHPPVEAAGYSIYYRSGAPPGDGERLARALAAIVAKAGAPVPDALRSLAP
jgi:hypothetical protein